MVAPVISTSAASSRPSLAVAAAAVLTANGTGAGRLAKVEIRARSRVGCPERVEVMPSALTLSPGLSGDQGEVEGRLSGAGGGNAQRTHAVAGVVARTVAAELHARHPDLAGAAGHMR